MKPKEFAAQIDEQKVVDAIARAERRTSGEIRVFVSGLPAKDPLASAQRQFQKLGMDRTAARNGVLLFFAPRDQQFAVVGDAGINEKCGPAFWHEVGTQLQQRLEAGDFTGGLVQAIETLGGLLERHFPIGAADRNELPNTIARERERDGEGSGSDRARV